MTKEFYIKSCLLDAISALDVADLPDRIQVGKDYIYPKVAIERIQSVLEVDKLSYFKRNAE